MVLPRLVRPAPRRRARHLSCTRLRQTFVRRCNGAEMWAGQPEKFEDQYEDALKELLKKKQSGQKIEAPREREPSKILNLMDALRRSVETERAGGERRKPAPRAGDHRAPKKAGRSNARAKKAG